VTVYRQISRRLRFNRGPGLADLVSERPRTLDVTTNRYRYTDLDANGESTTTVDISDDVQADVAALIRSGAIEPMPAEPAADVSARNDGEADSG
jgi:hypothetical protein